MVQVIDRTLKAGVFMITVGTQRDTSRRGLEVAQQYEGIWASVGLHPNHTVEQEFWDNDELAPEKQATPLIKTRAEIFDLEYYRELAKHPKCVGIGETGLDYYRIPANAHREQIISKQMETVRSQFDLATDAHLPVIIHCREAYEDQAKLIREYIDEGKLAERGVIHCFTGTEAEARWFLDLGFYISFSGIVTFSKELQKVAHALPIERLLIETDSPYLTPAPDRGKRNEPWKVKYVAEKIAELKGMAVEKVAEITLENTTRMFKIDVQN